MSKNRHIDAQSEIVVFISTAQNNGCPYGSAGFGKLTKSTVTCPISPFSYKIIEIDLARCTKFIDGKLVQGKKHPPLTNWVASILSNDPINFVSPLGSIKNETDGIESYDYEQRGVASITPPILQNFCI